MNPSDPAFPSEKPPFHPGLSIRSYIASQALQGILAHHGAAPNGEPDPSAAAQIALAYTDALLQALASPDAP